MFQRIKDNYNNVRRHKVMVLVIVILAGLCYKMFVSNYSVQSPIVSKRAESYQDVWNDRASALMEIDTLKAARDQANADIMQPVQP